MGIGQRSIDRGLVGYVERAFGDREFFGGDGVVERVRLGRVAHGGDHIVALPGECESGEQAEAAVGSGDENASHGGDPATAQLVRLPPGEL